MNKNLTHLIEFEYGTKRKTLLMDCTHSQKEIDEALEKCMKETGVSITAILEEYDYDDELKMYGILNEEFEGLKKIGIDLMDIDFPFYHWETEGTKEGGILIKNIEELLLIVKSTLSYYLPEFEWKIHN